MGWGGKGFNMQKQENFHEQSVQSFMKVPNREVVAAESMKPPKFKRYLDI